MNSDGEEVPGHDAREVSQLELGQTYIEMWPCPPPSPLSLHVPSIVLRKQLETEVPKVLKKQAFPSTLSWKDWLFRPLWTWWQYGCWKTRVIFPRGVNPVYRIWANEIPLRQHATFNWTVTFPTLITYNQIGVGGEQERVQKDFPLPKGATHREEAFSASTPHYIWPQSLFLWRTLKAEIKEISMVWSQRTAAAKGRLVQKRGERKAASRVMS